MTAVVILYSGLVVAGLGLASLARSLTRAAKRSRRRTGAALLALGLLLAATALALPARETRVAAPVTRLDELMPAYQFSERHRIAIRAPADRAFAAIQAVSADEIRFFRTLVWIRRAGCSGAEGILDPPPDLPLLEVATRTSFLPLALEPGRELVIGTLVVAPASARLTPRPLPHDFEQLNAPGFAKAAMSFRVEPDGAGGSVVTTETRVLATDPSTRRRFAAYWRFIYPGSALIRRMWLRAIRTRAEGG